jgi:5-guanidino-2-oxopentanoate decarboxylase
MASSSQSIAASPTLGSKAVVEGLLRAGITSGFGIPSIHNIAIYDVLRQTPQFQHWIVRHEQAAGYAADSFYRHSGKIAAIFASTGPGNLFTLVPLLESLQNGTPVMLVGTNIASSLLVGQGGALHETPQQIEIIRPLTRLARRVTSPDDIPLAFAEAAQVLHGPAPGPAFIEIPHDFLYAPLSASPAAPPAKLAPAVASSEHKLAEAAKLLEGSKRPVVILGKGVHDGRMAALRLAELLQSPVLTTTSGKGLIADDHALCAGCLSRLGSVHELLAEADLLVSIGAKLTEFDTGRYGLKLPARHLQLVEHPEYAGNRFPVTLQLSGDISAACVALAGHVTSRSPWFDLAAMRAAEKQRLDALNAVPHAALVILRRALHREDVLVNDQSILNYWASAFFPVLEPHTFLYPSGSGTLGFALPAAVGVACAMRATGRQRRILCIAGDGGFQYSLHELATVAQYGLPIKVLLVNDHAYGVIGFLQRSMFGQTHEVALKNPDFCKLAEAYGVPAERINSINQLAQRLPDWLDAPGPGLMEWQTELKAPWEAGAIARPTGVQPADRK